MMHANFMAVCFIEPELLPIEVLHCENRDFRLFCSCDLDLEWMSFIYELYPYSLGIYRMCKYELPTSRLSKVIIGQTRPKLYATPLRVCSTLNKVSLSALFSFDIYEAERQCRNLQYCMCNNSRQYRRPYQCHTHKFLHKHTHNHTCTRSHM